jgi:hypothetical protein
VNVARVCLALLLVLAGCTAPTEPPTATGSPSTATPTPAADAATPTAADALPPSQPTTPTTPRPDPATDRLGWEAGYWYDDPLSLNRSDGLNASERAAFVARTMARVERIRQLEFERSVPVELRSREAYRNDSAPIPDSAWNEQVWEALFLVGEDRRVSETFSALYSGSVLGYYSSAEDRIVVVSDSETPSIDRQTLSHELVHALQDQHFGFPRASTQDGSLAADAVVEGDATYVEQLYAERCAGEWDCVPRPDDGGGTSLGDMGVYAVVYHPYSDGAVFVHALRQRGGWAAVNDAYASPPRSTAQVIHPETYPDATATSVTVDDRSNATWDPVDHRPRADVVGEASLYATMWATGRVDSDHLYSPSEPYRRLNYTHPLTTGWAGDAVLPYRSDDGYGYVFESEWETERDAREFVDAYRSILTDRYDAADRGSNVYVIRAGPFADAFRVTRDGTTVTVVNAPTVDALDGIRDRED